MDRQEEQEQVGSEQEGVHDADGEGHALPSLDDGVKLCGSG